ncbi:hypothetical protein, partial [Escherichia coli]|uniref:hypothetical protein n=1 Tax=Escherichia coli TaxID=562 RepID=UPI00307ACEC1
MKGDKVPKGTPKDAVASSLAKKPPSKTVENDGKTPLGDKESTASGLSIKNLLGVPHWGLDFLNMRDPRPLQTTARSVPPKWEAREKKKPEVCADELG